MKTLDLSIIIVSFNTEKLTRKCIESVVQFTKEIVFEIIVIDNASTDGTISSIKSIKRITNGVLKIIKNDTNIGFGRANNQGINRAQGRYVLFLNSDTLIRDNVLGEMVKWMDKQSTVGIASCKLLNKDGSTQGTGGYFPTLIRVFSWMTIQDFPLVDKLIKPFHPMKDRSFTKADDFYEHERELDWVTGAFMLVRKEVLDEVHGFDEDYFMYTEEVDLCYKSKKFGWKVYYLPQWSIVHYGGASGTVQNSIINEFEGVKLFYKKHHSKFQYQILRFFLKMGAMGRIIVFGLKDGKKTAKIYFNALKTI